MMKINDLTGTLKKVPLILMALLLVITACKKNNTLPADDDNYKTKELQNWYDAQKLELADSEMLKGLNPLWSKSSISENDKELIYEVDLENTNHIFTTQKAIDAKDDDQYAARSLFKLVLIKDKTKKTIYGGYMNIVADKDAGNFNIQSIKYKKASNFTGHVKYYFLNGLLNNGWHYSNGKIDQSYSGADQTGSTVQTESYPCGSFPKYVTMCWDDTNCSKTLIGYDIVYCNRSLNPDLGDVGGSSGGGFTPRVPIKPRGTSFGTDPNCRNCKITAAKFPEFLEAAKKAGLEVTDAKKTTVTAPDGTQYEGTITEIYDPNGNLFAAYFFPDVDSDKFSVGSYYNMGNGAPQSSSSDPQTNGITYVGYDGTVVTAAPVITVEGAKPFTYLETISLEDADFTYNYDAYNILFSNCSAWKYAAVGPDGNYQACGVNGVNFFYVSEYQTGSVIHIEHFSLAVKQLYFEFPRKRANGGFISAGQAANITAALTDQAIKILTSQVDHSPVPSDPLTIKIMGNRFIRILQVLVQTQGGKVTKQSRYGTVPVGTYTTTITPGGCQ